jgi:glycosyltransferase involved in cell wall biosynthesis
MLISVVIPTYNRAALVGRAIGSALAQTHGDLEVIVVDDASTDATSEVVRGIRDPRVRLVALPRNAGVSAARNAGIRASRGEWVALLDSDDEWLPRKLELQIGRLQAVDDPRLAVIYGAYHERHDFTGRLHRGPRRFFEGEVFDRLIEYPGIRTPTVLARRQVLLAVGGFREELRCHEDSDLWFRLAAASHHFAAVREPVAIIHRHEGAHLYSDPVARAQALEIIDAEWGALVRRRGPRAYRRWRSFFEAHRGHFEYRQVRAAVARGDRRTAWRRCRAMAARATGSPRWVIQAVVLVLVGRRVYSLLAAMRSALVRALGDHA